MNANKNWKLELGANLDTKGNVHFCVWAPRCQTVEVKWAGQSGRETLSLVRDENGFFSGHTSNVSEGDKYYYHLDQNRDRPDPVSRMQPEGVHGPSEILRPDSFRWTDKRWKGVALRDYVMYELHIGTFTPEGTFDAAIKKLPYLKKLGVTSIEVMPVAQFPGNYNWGYDGVGLFAVQNSYGGAEGFKRFVNACHRHGLSVCLDVVYNHLGPEGNYLHDYGPYFTGKYNTPWGDAVNYDDRDSKYVREFVISNALYWFQEYHVDALRLDAIHSIHDASVCHILCELQKEVQSFAKSSGKKLYLIAESDLNDVKVIEKRDNGGYELDAQWSDDFHHAVHVTLTSEKTCYYQDYSGVEDVAKSIQDHFVYDGKHSQFRGRDHGNSAKGFDGEKFVINLQNHDQVGNRPYGERLSSLVSFDAQKASAMLLMMAPQIPLLWMGQEYGEKSPFLYFIDHTDENLVKAVREGRKNEFISRGLQDVPDPKDEQTFQSSKLQWELTGQDEHRHLLQLYQDMLLLRRKLKPLYVKNKTQGYFNADEKSIAFEYTASAKQRIAVIANFSTEPISMKLPFAKKKVQELLSTSWKKYGGTLQKKSARVFSKEIELFPESAMIGKVI